MLKKVEISLNEKIWINSRVIIDYAYDLKKSEEMIYPCDARIFKIILEAYSIIDLIDPKEEL